MEFESKLTWPKSMAPRCGLHRSPGSGTGAACAGCGSRVMFPGKKFCPNCRVFALVKGDKAFRIYGSRSDAHADLSSIQAKANSYADGFSVSLSELDPPDVLEVVDDVTYFVCGNTFIDCAYFDSAKVTVGGEKELPTLTPAPALSAHRNAADYGALYYERVLVKVYVSVRAVTGGPLVRWLLLWGEVEMTGDRDLRVELASAIMNTDDTTARALLRQFYTALGNAKVEKTWPTLEEFARDATKAAKSDPKIAALLKTFGTKTQNAESELTVAINKMYSSLGPLPVTLCGVGGLKAQLTTSDFVQLNYIVPLKNLGFVPSGWLADIERLKTALQGPSMPTNATDAIKVLDQRASGAHQKSILWVFLATTKFQKGAPWFQAAQLVAHTFVETQLKLFQEAGQSVTGIDALLLKSIFTVYLFDMAYETSLDSKNSTQKDNLGHLVKSATLDLVRLTTSNDDKRFLAWFTQQADWLKTLDTAIGKVAYRFGDNALKFRSGASHPKYALNALPVAPPSCVEQIHEVTFKTGLATLFYDETEGGPYATERRADAPGHELREVRMMPTSNVFVPIKVGGEWHVLLESRSPSYTIAELLVPNVADSKALEILNVVQSPLWTG